MFSPFSFLQRIYTEAGSDVENLREQFEVQKGTLLLVKLGTFYGQGTRTMAALADVTLTEAGPVTIDFLCPFCPQLPDVI